MQTYFGELLQKLREKSTDQELLTLLDILEQNHFDKVDEAMASAYSIRWQKMYWSRTHPVDVFVDPTDAERDSRFYGMLLPWQREIADEING